MKNDQDELVAEFCAARIVKEAEHAAMMEKYMPVQKRLIDYMMENGMDKIMLGETERLEIHSWKKDGVENYSIWWRK